MMNDPIYDHHHLSTGSYAGNGTVSSSYQSPYPSTFTPNTHLTHSYSPARHEQSRRQANCKPSIMQSSSFNQRDIDLHHRFDRMNLHPISSHLNGYPVESDESTSTAYYDRIHAQVRSHASASRQYQHSTSHDTNHSNTQYSHPPPPPPMNAAQSEATFLVVPAIEPTEQLPQHQPSIPGPSTFTPTVLVDESVRLSQLSSDSSPSLDYLHHSMESLIQRLASTDTYIPKLSFIYPMLLCSRMNIRPSLLFNQLARTTINSISTMTHDRSLRTMNNFLYVLSQWTRTFPYDFRNSEMMSQLEDLFKKMVSYDSCLQSDTYHIYRKLRSKLKALDLYEEYIRQLNKKAIYNLTQLTLFTDIMNECPTPILFAQQLTHIELDRLKPVGAEELIQYFIMKLASEEARAHPTRATNLQSSMSDVNIVNQRSQYYVHDKKLTFCLEAYIQWFNRLTFFITTEIVKHTQRRSRVRLINYFIDTAYECFRLHNFNSMIGILGGLNMQPVRRLKKTWEKIQLDKFQQLEQYINVSKNFASYRLVLKVAMEDADKHAWATDKIVIPFTSIILQDVYYIKTHSKDFTSAGGINLKKYYSMAKFISEEFVQCKQSKCSFERNDMIINYVVTSATFNEDSLMLASFECEPPATLNEKEKYRTLQKSMNPST